MNSYDSVVIRLNTLLKTTSSKNLYYLLLFLALVCLTPSFAYSQFEVSREQPKEETGTIIFINADQSENKYEIFIKLDGVSVGRSSAYNEKIFVKKVLANKSLEVVLSTKEKSYTDVLTLKPGEEKNFNIDFSNVLPTTTSSSSKKVKKSKKGNTFGQIFGGILAGGLEQAAKNKEEKRKAKEDASNSQNQTQDNETVYSSTTDIDAYSQSTEPTQTKKQTNSNDEKEDFWYKRFYEHSEYVFLNQVKDEILWRGIKKAAQNDTGNPGSRDYYQRIVAHVKYQLTQVQAHQQHKSWYKAIKESASRDAYGDATQFPADLKSIE